MTAVGAVVLETILVPGFLAEVARKGDRLSEKLSALLAACGLRGERGAGLLLNAPRPKLLRFMPALTVTDEEIDTMVEWLGELLRWARGLAPEGIESQSRRNGADRMRRADPTGVRLTCGSEPVPGSGC